MDHEDRKEGRTKKKAVLVLGAVVTVSRENGFVLGLWVSEELALIDSDRFAAAQGTQRVKGNRQTEAERERRAEERTFRRASICDTR
jgi:hypothetical protein